MKTPVDAKQAEADGVSFFDVRDDVCGEIHCYSVRALDFGGNASESDPICIEVGAGAVDPPSALVAGSETDEPPYGCTSSGRAGGSASWLAALVAFGFLRIPNRAHRMRRERCARG